MSIQLINALALLVLLTSPVLGFEVFVNGQPYRGKVKNTAILSSNWMLNWRKKYPVKPKPNMILIRIIFHLKVWPIWFYLKFCKQLPRQKLYPRP